MERRLRLTLLVALLLPPIGALAGTTVTVHTVDQGAISGMLISMDHDSIVVEVNKGKGPPQPTTLPFKDLARVVLRDAPSRAQASSEQPAVAKSSRSSKSILGALKSFFSSDETEEAPTPAPPAQPVAPAPVKADPDSWQFRLMNGDSIHARLAEWTGTNPKIKLGDSGAEAAELPREQIAELWCSRTDAVAKAVALHRTAGADDIAFVEKDQDIIPVNGRVVGIDAGMLKFRYGDAERKIAMNRLVGILFAVGGKPPSADGFHQSIAMDAGDELSGAWTGIDKDCIVLHTAWGANLRVPFRSIYTIDMVNGRQVYLSDLTPVKVEQTPYFGRVVPYRVDAALDGGPLKLGTTPCMKGIAVHSRCVLVYQTQGTYERFRSRLGFELPEGKIGRVAVRVLADGKPLYQNGDLRGDQPPVDLDVDISGQRQLTLEVDFGKDQDAGDRVVWADARLVRSKLPDERGK